MKKCIELKDVSKNFLLKKKTNGFINGVKEFFAPTYKEVHAVKNISLDINQGEVVAFIGPNGSGKSTTIKMITGILYPTHGDIRVLGHNPMEERTKLAYHIGTVFGQRSQLWYHLPASDTFTLLSYMYELKRSEYKERLSFLLKTFEIEHLISHPIRKLSLGQRMRCELVASLLHRPKVLFLDEPTIGLDVIAKQKVREVLAFLNKHEGVTIFLTSHDMGDIEAIADRTVVIAHGRIMFDGSTFDLKRKYVTTKIVEFVLENGGESFAYSQSRILEQKSNYIKVEISTQVQVLEKLLAYAMHNFTVIDVSIFETPLESVITHLYKDAAYHD